MIMKMNIRQNRGSVLVISLLVLLVLTILGITALDTTVMEERMSANTRQRNVAYQAAETALKEAEQWLLNAAGNVVVQADLAGRGAGTGDQPFQFQRRQNVGVASVAELGPEPRSFAEQSQ